MNDMNGNLDISNIISYLKLSVEENDIKDYVDMLIVLHRELKQNNK